ncbi:hypothetical protein pneo_cds_616 [Pandoravirus neocaledonia]|uniref:Uncharacterized protein n=1 Tax=Pandoravirus neocaledonia TaxID=2107708 RepID=A0A2U7UCR0_9VIRU|nr:hypothetical protein pneo_cds_616 [Pandoravirus neocaledonia]AVK76223.1 hypothetical protein pneo_cds_616 [Pandoravirus neocaledonia]
MPTQSRRCVCVHAASAGRFDIVMSLAPDATEATTCLRRMASGFGRIDVLAWRRANGLQCDGWALCEAAMLGQNGCAPVAARKRLPRPLNRDSLPHTSQSP